MKTTIRRQGDTVIVSLEGQISFEDQLQLQNQLNQCKETDHIVFDFEKLDFVGSSSISAFVRTLTSIHAASKTKPRYCSVKSEFQKIMKALGETEAFDFYETRERALDSTSH